MNCPKQPGQNKHLLLLVELALKVCCCIVHFFFESIFKFIEESQREQIIVPDSLLKELASLRISYAMLLSQYKKKVQNSTDAQEKFVEIVPTVLGRQLSSDLNTQSYFDTLVEEEISLFNVNYLIQICVVFPKDVW